MSDLSEIFGKPGEGIHTHVAGFAIADVALTAGAAVLIARATNRSVPAVFVALMAVGVAAHWYFGVPTALNKKLGLAKEPEQNMRIV